MDEDYSFEIPDNLVYPKNLEEIKVFHKQLGAERVVYQYNFSAIEEGEEIKKYLIRNT